AAPRHGDDDGRARRRIAERRAQLADAEVQAGVEVDEPPLSPERPAQLVARHEASVPLDHEEECLERLRLEPDDLAAAPQLGAILVELERSEADMYTHTGPSIATTLTMPATSVINRGVPAPMRKRAA